MIPVSRPIDKVRINLEDTGKDEYIYLDNTSGGSQESVPSNALGYPMVMPVKLRKDENEEFWIFPVEPMITVDGGNVVAKRTVAKGKGRGTIKERWTQDDYQITIEGTFMSYDDANTFPEQDLQKLRELCENGSVDIECNLTKIFNINHLVIDTFNFPFTKGDNVQRFTISAYSDDITELLIQEDV